MKKIRSIGLTYDLASDYEQRPDDPPDRYYEFDTPDIVHTIGDAIAASGVTVQYLGNVSHVLPHIERIRKSVDIVFNTCEGLNGRNREAQMPLLLEYYHIPYIGSDALTMSLTLDKVMAKKVFIADSIRTPAYMIADTAITRSAVAHIRFPLIVKPRWEGSSKGLTPASKVYTVQELNTQIGLITKNYHQPALVEEFISGRECTVLLIGNGDNVKVFPPLEIQINQKKVGDDIFIGRFVYSDDVTYTCPAEIPARTAKHIMDMAKQAYKAVNCLDFARIDFRVTTGNVPYILEINPLPALSREDTFPTIAKATHTTYEKLIASIIRTAAARYSLTL